VLATHIAYFGRLDLSMLAGALLAVLAVRLLVRSTGNLHPSLKSHYLVLGLIVPAVAAVLIVVPLQIAHRVVYGPPQPATPRSVLRESRAAPRHECC
jgi:hypothetical protein